MRPIIARAKELKVSGHSVEDSTKILSNQEKRLDLVELALFCAYDKKCSYEKQPKKYSDIKHFVRCSIFVEKPQEFIKALTESTKYGNIIDLHICEEVDLISYINYLQKNRSEKIIEEIHGFLEPFFNDFLLRISTYKQVPNNVSFLSNEEYILECWKSFFGIWLPETRDSLNDEGEEIDIEEMEDSYYCFCPKYKSEVNIETVCKMSKCPFFKEEIQEYGNLVLKCKFKG